MKRAVLLLSLLVSAIALAKDPALPANPFDFPTQIAPVDVPVYLRLVLARVRNEVLTYRALAAYQTILADVEREVAKQNGSEATAERMYLGRQFLRLLVVEADEARAGSTLSQLSAKFQEVTRALDGGQEVVEKMTAWTWVYNLLNRGSGVPVAARLKSAMGQIAKNGDVRKRHLERWIDLKDALFAKLLSEGDATKRKKWLAEAGVGDGCLGHLGINVTL